jgi:hypothetical protein
MKFLGPLKRYTERDIKKIKIREHLITPNTVNGRDNRNVQTMNTNRMPLQEFKCRPAGRRDCNASGWGEGRGRINRILRARNRLGGQPKLRVQGRLNCEHKAE